MKNRIICSKWGETFDDSDVNTLHRQVEANCSVPFDFICYDKFKHDLSRFVPHNRKGHHVDDQGGLSHWRKLTLFDDVHFGEDDKILYLDLDVDVKSDLAYFFELENDNPYIIWNHWWERKPEEWLRQYHQARCPLYNSSTLLWKTGQNRAILAFLLAHAEEIFFTYKRIDTFMFHCFGPHSTRDHFKYFDEGIITSHRLVGDSNPGIIHSYEGILH